MNVEYVKRNGSGEPGRPTTRVKVNGTEITLTSWKIYEYVKVTNEFKIDALVRRFRLTRGRVYQCLRELRKAGLIETGSRFRFAE